MTRKQIVAVWLPVLALALLSVACSGKKKPQTEAEMTAPAPAPPPSKEVMAPPQPSTSEDMQESPLSKDLDAVNHYVTEQGLIGDVFFAFDKYELQPEARERLAKNADFMKSHPEFVFTVEGHCDERGTNEYNLALGEKRASAARDYLVSLGVSAGRLKTISYGEERPFCSESTEACWAKNRRAHFQVTARSNVG